MNKTITSNIAGAIFHIDENAYHKLEQYLQSIRTFFSGSEGEEDIVSGIEERIAEMFHARLKDGRTVVSMPDVEEVITIMGQPEAFVEDDEDERPRRNTARGGNRASKRLFRDPDNRVLGGVCSGISHYLGINDGIWLRLAFLLTFIFAGSGLLLYIILWVLIPEAKTPSDKLEMRGENVNVNNISRTVNEEMEGLRQKWDSSMADGNSALRQTGNFFMRGLSLLAQLVIALFRFIGRFLGLILLIVGIFTFVSLLGVSAGLPALIDLFSEGALSSDALGGLLDNMAGGSFNAVLSSIAFLLLFGIPFLAMAFLGARLLFNFRAGNKWIGLSFAGLWTLGWILAFAMAAIIGRDFSSKGSRTETVELEFSNGTDEQPIVLALNHELGENEPTEEAEVFGLEILVSDGQTSIYGKPELDIVKSANGKVELVMERTSRGSDRNEASERANAIDYGFVKNDSALLFNGYFAIPDADKWRGQDVKLVLRVPEGKTILLTEELEKIIYDIDNVTRTYDGDMGGRRWKMTTKGLECVDCEGLEEDIERTLEREERKIRRLERKLEAEMDDLEEEIERFEKEIGEEEAPAPVDGEDERVIRKRAVRREVDVSTTDDMQEVLLKRVIKATYRLGPETIRRVTYTVPG